jgi:predicted ferric reductase
VDVAFASAPAPAPTLAPTPAPQPAGTRILDTDFTLAWQQTDTTTTTMTLTRTSDTSVWLGVGIGATATAGTTMAGYKFLVGTGTGCELHSSVTVNADPPLDTNSATLVTGCTGSFANGVQTYTFTVDNAALGIPSSGDACLAVNWAYGSSATFSYHPSRGNTDCIAFAATGPLAPTPVPVPPPDSLHAAAAGWGVAAFAMMLTTVYFIGVGVMGRARSTFPKRVREDGSAAPPPNPGSWYLAFALLLGGCALLGMTKCATACAPFSDPKLTCACIWDPSGGMDGFYSDGELTLTGVNAAAGAALAAFVALVCVGFWLSTARPSSWLHFLHTNHALKLFHARGHPLGRFSTTVEMTNGELLVVLFWVLLQVNVLIQFDGRLANGPATEATLRNALKLGHLVELAFGLQLLPVTRNSIWVTVFGVAFERAIKLHRTLGFAITWLVTAHAFAWWARWAQLGQLKDTLLFRGATNQYAPPAEGQWNPYYTLLWQGYVAWACVLLLCATSFNWVRRNYFHVFYAVHCLCFPLIYIFGIMHSMAVGGYMWQYCLLGISLYLFDVGCQLRNAYLRPVEVLSFKPERTADTVALTLRRTDGQPLGHVAGQYCFLSVPSVSGSEWHPFSVCSPPASDFALAGSNDPFSFKIKSMGADQWTGKLLALAKTYGDLGRKLTVRVDGPYGLPGVDLDDYNQLVLVAGGIGITPVACILQGLMQRYRLSASTTARNTAAGATLELGMSRYTTYLP